MNQQLRLLFYMIVAALIGFGFTLGFLLGALTMLVVKPDTPTATLDIRADVSEWVPVDGGDND